MEPVLYIIMRNDLDSLNPGKAMAQASHAASQLAQKVSKLKDKSDTKIAYDEWIKQAEGFGKVVVLESDRHSLELMIKESDVCLRGTVIDPSYPFLLQDEIKHFIRDDIAKVIDLQYDVETKDRYGMIKATRKEGTCAWFFITNEQSLESFKDLADVYKVKLAR